MLGLHCGYGCDTLYNMKKIWLSLAFLLSLSPLVSLAAPVKAKPKIAPKPQRQVYINKSDGFTLRYPLEWKAFRNAEIDGAEGETVDILVGNPGNVHAAVAEGLGVSEMTGASGIVVAVKGGEAEYWPWQLRHAPDQYPEGIAPIKSEMLLAGRYVTLRRWLGKGLPGDSEGLWVGYVAVTSAHRAVRMVASIPSGPEQTKQLKAVDAMVKSIQFVASHRLKNQKLPEAEITIQIDPNELP